MSVRREVLRRVPLAIWLDGICYRSHRHLIARISQHRSCFSQSLSLPHPWLMDLFVLLSGCVSCSPADVLTCSDGWMSVSGVGDCGSSQDSLHFQKPTFVTFCSISPLIPRSLPKRKLGMKRREFIKVQLALLYRPHKAEYCVTNDLTNYWYLSDVMCK